MLGIGDKLPEFKATGVVSNDLSDAFTEITNETNGDKWQVLFFWPKDFTFICPTEIAEFGELNGEFEAAGAKVLGISTDSEFVHLAWRKDHSDLNNLPFPMVADITRELSEGLGILNEAEGVCYRATYIVDPEGVIRHVSVNDLSVGRSPQEVLRILKGLQDGGLMPCNWKPGEDALKVA